MSTSNTAIATTPTTEHPQTRQEQAFALYCNGLRSPAIAKQLAVPERTVRAWIRAILDEQAKSRSNNLQAIASLAEERQLQIAAASWQAYQRLATFEELQLDYLQNGTHEEFAAHPPRITAAGARYLALAQRATHEVAKLQGAYTCPPPASPPVEVIFTVAYPHPGLVPPPPGQPNLSGPALERYRYERYIAGLEAQVESDRKQLADGRARLAELQAAGAPPTHPSSDPDTPPACDPDTPAFADPEFPAESATAISPLPADGSDLVVGASAGRPQSPATRFPAQSPTATSPQGEGPGVRSPAPPTVVDGNRRGGR